MTSRDSDPSGSKDAREISPSPPDPSVQVELDRQITADLKSGLVVFVIAGILLFLICQYQSSNPLAFLWLAGLAISSLYLWVWLYTKPQQQVVAKITMIICALFCSLAGPVFINSDQLANSLTACAIIIGFASLWPMLYLHLPIYRHLFLLSIFSSTSFSLVLRLPEKSLIPVAMIAIVYLAVNRSCTVYRRAFIANIDRVQRADELTRQAVNTSKKITSLIEQTPLGFIEWNQDREIISWNPAATTIFGFSKAEALSRTTDFLFEDKKTFLMQQAEHDLFLFGKDFSGTAENITSDGATIICEWNETPLFDDDMNVIGAASFVEDVTDRVRMQTRIKQQAYFDPLTGLPNRHRLMEELNRVISLAQRTQNFCALLFIDLDHFKEINDSRGHHYGDLALTMFAQRLRKVIRTQETVARLGGDEFVVLLERLGTEGETARLQIAQVAEKIIDAANEQFIIKGEKFQISCSIGIVFFNDGSSDGNSILEQADQALYTIKRQGKSNYYFHNRELSY